MAEGEIRDPLLEVDLPRPRPPGAPPRSASSSTAPTSSSDDPAKQFRAWIERHLPTGFGTPPASWNISTPSERAAQSARNITGRINPTPGVPVPGAEQPGPTLPPGAQISTPVPEWKREEDPRHPGREREVLKPTYPTTRIPGQEWRGGNGRWYRMRPGHDIGPGEDFSATAPSERGFLYRLRRRLFGGPPSTGARMGAVETYDESTGAWGPVSKETWPSELGPSPIEVEVDPATGKPHAKPLPHMGGPRHVDDPTARERWSVTGGGAPKPTSTGTPTTAPGTSPAAPGAPAKETPGAAGSGTPGAPRTSTGRPDFEGMPDWMKALPPEIRKMFPAATGNEQRPDGGAPSNPMDFIRRMIEGAAGGGMPGGGMPGDPSMMGDPGSGDPYSAEGFGPSDDNVYTSPSGRQQPLLPPLGDAGGGGAGGPHLAAAAPATAPPAGTPEAVASGAPGAGATPGMAAGPADGGTAPLPPGGGAVPPVATAALGGGLGTADGGAADTAAVGLAPLGALGPIGRARSAREASVMNAAAAQNFGQSMNPQLHTERARYREEMARDPMLRTRMLQVMYNEQGRHPQGVQAIAESALNRASVRRTSLRRQLGWYRHEPHGYYQTKTMGRGYDRYLGTLNQALENALNGSNISNFATDNSSGNLASRERSSGRFRYRSGYSGETFFAPGWAEPKFARDWDHWVSGMGAAQTAGR